MSDPTPAAAPAAKKKSSLVLFLVAGVVLAGGGGGGALFYLRGRDPAPVVEKKLSEHGLVKLEPFVVNLADEGNKHFLRASIQLVVDSPEEALEFAEKPVLLMGARSAIVNTLTEQTAEHLTSADGKTKLREELKEHVSASLKEIEVVDVLFSDFVIQY